MWRVLLATMVAAVLEPVRAMSWCEYFERVGHPRPECSPRITSALAVATYNRFKTIDSMQSNDITSLEKVDSSFEYPAYPLCKGLYHACMRSSSCESGTLCTLGATSKPCCTSTTTKCPTVDVLKIQCHKSRPVNWCSRDYECKTTTSSSQMCCPTGCGYNICLNPIAPYQQSSIYKNNMVFTALMQSADCPDPYKLDLKCNAPNPVSWCHKQSDCPRVNSLHPRRCCRTLCGYNACLVRYAGKWMVA